MSINFKHENIVASGRYWVARIFNDKTEHVLTLDVGAGDTDKTSIEVGLPAGTYYVKVNSDDYEASHEYEYSSKTYTLKVNYTKSSAWETEKNNSYQTADTVEIDKEYSGGIQFTSDLDYYKFSVEKAGFFDISFKHNKIMNAGRYWVVRLYNDNAQELVKFGINGTNADTKYESAYLGKGTYLLHVMAKRLN